MLLMSWNVAAWSTTLRKLDVSLQAFLERHKCDILCLQEVKVNKENLADGSLRAMTHVEGWDTFWAPCVSKEGGRGFQGVATYVKSGKTIRADMNVLDDNELNEMGRCIYTEHEKFVLFNVYAPAGSNGLTLRMRFFRALRRAMTIKRESTGKPVILCGDLNLSAVTSDCHHEHVRLRIDRLLADDFRVTCNCKHCPRMIEQIRTWWPKITQVLATKRALPEQTQSSATQEYYEKFKVTVEIDGKDRKIGTVHSSKEYCLHLFETKPYQWFDPQAGEDVLAYPGDSIGLRELAVLMKAVGQIAWSSWIQRVFALHYGESCESLPVLDWFHNCLIRHDGMVDSFRHFFSNMTDRFTCWSQHTNQRYVNEGRRLDYIMVDKSMMMMYATKNGTSRLRCGCAQDHGFDFYKAGLCAATCMGLFQPAPLQGGGMEKPSSEAIESQFGEPHTGIVYTPPIYSDHVAVTLLLDDRAFQSCALDSTDRNTMTTQPHRSQRSIKDFFGGASSSSLVTTIPAKRKILDDNDDNEPEKIVCKKCNPAKGIKCIPCSLLKKKKKI